jgi:hypothetical protein
MDLEDIKLKSSKKFYNFINKSMMEKLMHMELILN